MICIEINGVGVLQAVNPQPSDISTCALVAGSALEVASNPIVSLTSDEGGAIGVAILGLWAVAWGVRQIANVGNFANHNKENES